MILQEAVRCSMCQTCQSRPITHLGSRYGGVPTKSVVSLYESHEALCGVEVFCCIYAEVCRILYFAFHEADDATLADSNAVGHGLRTRSNRESKFPGRLDVQIWVIAAATYFDWS